MSNPIYGQIKIFGDVPEALLEELYGYLKDAFGSQSCGDLKERTKGQPLLDWYKNNLDKNNVLFYADGNANWGEFPDLESFLQEHKISYIRESLSDGGECSPEVIYFNGNTIIAQRADINFMPILTIEEVLNLCNIAIKMEKEIKKGNAPLYATEEDDTVQSLMAKYSLSELKPNKITAINLIMTYIKDQYPSIPDTLPPFNVIKE